MFKNKHDYDIDPRTPTQRAETVLLKAEQQFGRLVIGKLGNTGSVDDISLGYYLICGTDPHQPEPPILIEEGDSSSIAERFGDRSLRLVLIHRNAIGQCDFQTQLSPIRVDTYFQQLQDGNVTLAMPDAILSPSAEGPTINGFSVDAVHAMDGSDSNLNSTLTRLEQVMRTVEEATIIRVEPRAAT
jgi:hypothetical protein